MSSRPFAAPHFRTPDGRHYRARAAGYQYTPLDVCKAYNIPVGTYNGKGATVAIGELGGSFAQSDLTAYLQALGLPDNRVTVVNGSNQQPDPSGADVEVMLDVCIVAAIANGANIRLYFAQNTSQDFINCQRLMVADGCDAISWSWGAPEDQWSTSDMQAMSSAIQQGANLGINTFVAAGDNGSSDGESGLHADFPSSAPYALGCGGTTLKASGSQILSETVWNDGASGGATGGGFSSLFPKPSYQASLVQGSARGVPDVCGVADPATGWIIRAGGQNQVVGGTSAVAPMWAALTALLMQAKGARPGYLATLLYGNPGALRDILTGSN